MMFVWIILIVAAVYFLSTKNYLKLSGWMWALIAVLALPVLGMLFHGRGGMMGGRGMMGGGGMMGGRGMMDGRGMMGPGGMHNPGMMTPPAGTVAATYPWVHWVMVGVVVLALALVVWFSYKRSKLAPAPIEDEALKQLRMRLANGEVSAEEFDVLQQKLKG